MLYEFSFRLPINGHDIEGTAELSEHFGGPDADGYQHFQIDDVRFRWGAYELTAPDRLLASYIIAWVKQRLEGDDDLQAAWDEHAGNRSDNPNAGNGTYAVRLGRVA